MDDIDALLSNVDDADTHDYERIIREGIASEGEDHPSPPEATPAAEGSDGTPAAGQEPPDAITEELPAAAEPIPTAVPEAVEPESGQVQDIPWSVRGTRPWNTREPYILPLTPEYLQREKKYLRSSFYFIKEWTGDDALKEAIREHLLQFIRKPSQTIQPELEHFIYTTLIDENQKVLSLFQFTGETGHLFLYHCGPMTVYRMILSLLQHRKCGYCYRLEPGNRSVRFFPEEFIKEKVLGWFEENINKLNLPFDSIQHLNDIKNTVAKKYSIDVRRFNHTVEQINMKLGQDKRINRDKLLSHKGEELFGLSAIEVYKRFIERTIFHRAQ
ncbi:MAG: hypothetical protein JXA20_19855 [Spirochaetes bacterium]|nr:hypothetical protein [Spirochaetota bacterium]